MRKFRIPVKYKRTGKFISGLILASACFFGSYTMFRKSDISLTQISKYTGAVTEKGITQSKSRTARGIVLNLDVFYFKLKGLDQTLGVYNISQEYQYFENAISITDTLTVYYLNSNLKPVNTETFQIENGKTVILKKEELQDKSLFLAILILTVGFILLGMTVYQDKKYWK